MKNSASQFFDALRLQFNQLSQDTAIELAHTLSESNDIHLFGNGGSSAICSHVSVDLTKACGLKAHAYTDPSLITCFGNDFGYENAYAEMLQRYGKIGDAVIAISSRGESSNIYNLIIKSNQIGCKTIVLTGFDKNNPISQLPANLQIHVASENYNVVEIMHQTILLSACEELMNK